MLNQRSSKLAAAVIVIGIVGLAALASTSIQTDMERARQSFRTVVLIERINELLLNAMTSAVEYVSHLSDDRQRYAAVLLSDLSILQNRWNEFRDGYRSGYPGISDMFGAPILIDEDARVFVSLGKTMAGLAAAEFQHEHYHRFLNLGRLNLQKSLITARQVAKSDFTDAQQRMTLQLQLSVGTIMLLIASGLWLTYRTLTASAAARDAAQSAARARSEFLATMSHEIRTPMSGIIGMADLLARTDLTEKQKLYVSTIAASGEALTTIVNDVLDLAKLDAGKMTVLPQPFNLAAFVQDIAMLLAPRASERGNELAVRLQPDLPIHLIGDAGHLRQVLINLTGNAIKFTRDGTVLIDISGTVDSRAAHLTIKVQDTGIGIPADKCSRIFDQFEQVAGAHKDGQKGTGLGLPITRKLVQLMGGSIRVESKEGDGSCFFVMLDLPVDPDAAPPERTPANIAGGRVLVVAKNEINRRVLLEQLEGWDLKPVAVAGTDEALERIHLAAARRLPFHLAILDDQLPGSDSIGLAGAIRADKLSGDLPILMLTPIMATHDEETFRKLKIDRHLTKPTPPLLLRDAVFDIVEWSRRDPGPPPTLGGSAAPDASA